MIPVFYATDRARAPLETIAYLGAREPEDRLHLGRFIVSVPRDHAMGQIERPRIWTFWKDNPDKHFIIVDRDQLAYDTFYSDLRAHIGKSTSGQAFVFIHGYNVDFEGAIYRTGQLAYDLGFDGAPILYSWPSVASTADYRIDQRHVEWTVEHLRWFLEDIRQKTGASMIHLISHSMGNRALTAALALMEPKSGTSRFTELVLTAPDIDAGVFPTLAKRFRRMVSRATIYASENDLALKAAMKYDTAQRVGSTKPRIVLVDQFETVDASNVDTSLLGHSYFGDSSKVMSDLYYVLRGLSPDARAFLNPIGTPPKKHWAFRR